MTRAHGDADRLAADMVAVLAVRVASGRVDGVGHRGHEFGDRRPVGCGQQGERARPPGRGQFLGMVLDGVVQQSGADHVRLPDVVVNHDPESDAEQMVHVRLTLAVIGGVQTGRELERLLHLSPAGRVGELRRLRSRAVPGAPARRTGR